VSEGTQPPAHRAWAIESDSVLLAGADRQPRSGFSVTVAPRRNGGRPGRSGRFAGAEASALTNEMGVARYGHAARAKTSDAYLATRDGELFEAGDTATESGRVVIESRDRSIPSTARPPATDAR
jgi:hypothetical protein